MLRSAMLVLCLVCMSPCFGACFACLMFCRFDMVLVLFKATSVKVLRGKFLTERLPPGFSPENPATCLLMLHHNSSCRYVHAVTRKIATRQVSRYLPLPTQVRTFSLSEHTTTPVPLVLYVADLTHYMIPLPRQ